MWQAVDPNVPAQVQKAVDVLKAHDARWVSADYLKQWIERHDAQLFYLSDPAYELVLGMAHVEPKDEWRVVAGGGRGALDHTAGQQMVQQVVDFMQARGAKHFAIYNENLPASDPNRILVEGVMAIMRQRPEVAEVQGRKTPLGQRYDLIFH